jgi:hypothetical protein
MNDNHAGHGFCHQAVAVTGSRQTGRTTLALLGWTIPLAGQIRALYRALRKVAS